MTDNNIADATQTLMTAFQKANEAVAEHLLAAQERARSLAEAFFTEGMEVLKANQQAGEDLLAAQERSVQYTQHFFTQGMEVLKANQTAAQSLVAVQERNIQYVERFFQSGTEVLKSQGESMRALMQDLEEQVRKQQEALQTLSHSPLDLTLDFLRSPLASYQRALGMAEDLAQEGYKRAQKLANQPKQTGRRSGAQQKE